MGSEPDTFLRVPEAKVLPEPLPEAPTGPGTLVPVSPAPLLFLIKTIPSHGECALLSHFSSLKSVLFIISDICRG